MTHISIEINLIEYIMKYKNEMFFRETKKIVYIFR